MSYIYYAWIDRDNRNLHVALENKVIPEEMFNLNLLKILQAKCSFPDQMPEVLAVMTTHILAANLEDARQAAIMWFARNKFCIIENRYYLPGEKPLINTSRFAYI